MLQPQRQCWQRRAGQGQGVQAAQHRRQLLPPLRQHVLLLPLPLLLLQHLCRSLRRAVAAGLAPLPLLPPHLLPLLPLLPLAPFAHPLASL